MSEAGKRREQESDLIFVEASWAMTQSFRRDPLQAPFFEGLRNGVLLGVRDPVAGHVVFPPRSFSEESFSLLDELVPVGPGGVIRTVTRQPAREGPPSTAVFVQLDGAGTAAAGRLRGEGAKVEDPVTLIGRRCRAVIADPAKGAWSDYWFELEPDAG